ncbi:hypothetical protein [Myxococcus xanthus]|uniref:hypothetical protein n=1 Tax=Myxococcus xanthus TaxID=34 RepID=UPI001163C851|nr:hypothetical protein [Myxococcus xanthus]QDE99979.1 hypothetical protein BHS05_31435 [Myxococcus xanthus]
MPPERSTPVLMLPFAPAYENLDALRASAAWTVLDEALHWGLAVGGALVLAGGRLTQTVRTQPPPAPLPLVEKRRTA